MARPPSIRAFRDELVVDSFAGGGGASTGIERAIGRPCDIAINHDAAAIAMHRANHPETKHYCESVWKVDPRKAAAGRPVGLAWFSPDCTHFSKAKGGKPVAKEIRGLAWVAWRWAKLVKPRIIIVENVQEFQDWGPLIDTPKGPRPDPARKGQTFKQWLGKLRAQGYTIDFTPMVAADYGAPTTRKRLFLVARRDSEPTWPDPTHGPKAGRDWVPASEIIDWSLECPSIFERKRPLADATLRRIAEGVRRYVLEPDGEPFMVPGQDAIPTLIQTGYGERPGQRPRVPGLEKPLGTIVAGGSKHALVKAMLTPDPAHESDQVRAFLTKYYGGGDSGTNGTAQDLRDPLHTIRAKSCFGLVTVRGHGYRISDIGMRMLQPHELYAAQGFPRDYTITEGVDDLGNAVPLTQTEQIRMVGNSVSPACSEAVVAAQV